MTVRIEKTAPPANAPGCSAKSQPLPCPISAPDSASATLRPLLTTVTLEAPLLGVESARLALRCGEDDIMEWILSGDLAWAFDIRRLRARRPCLRILTESVAARQQSGGRLPARERETRRNRPFRGIFDAIFRHRRPVLTSTELARVWNCGASHIHNLIQDGLLRPLEKKYVPREVFQFPREAVFDFMQTRRMK